MLVLREGLSGMPSAGDEAAPENRDFCLGFLMVQDLNLLPKAQGTDHVTFLNNGKQRLTCASGDFSLWLSEETSNAARCVFE